MNQAAHEIDPFDPRIGLQQDDEFMLFVAPISSAFDFLTFYAMLHWFQANPPLFYTGWFVESLATRILVVGVRAGCCKMPR